MLHAVGDCLASGRPVREVLGESMSDVLWVVCAIVVGHFVADFVCQSDWMALNKSKQWDALAWHTGAYVFVMAGLLCAAWNHDWLDAPSRVDAAKWLMLNAAVHFVQDAITSRINARLWQANQRHWFFVGIGADQCLHYLTMFVTASWWLV